ncbi:hypothetical protein Tco_0975120 [Tanacetum coccineum]|uniref:Uncharacterized protein n=1 Tax=Tanacetum coccineum TaxID=301880 RepID=A0ABQ5EDI8_9ASTR
MGTISGIRASVDEKTSEEYPRDIDIEYHERALLEEVSDKEEVTQVKVLMALADDELTVGKNHARNGEWVVDLNE